MVAKYKVGESVLYQNQVCTVLYIRISNSFSVPQRYTYTLKQGESLLGDIKEENIFTLGGVTEELKVVDQFNPEYYQNDEIKCRHCRKTIGCWDIILHFDSLRGFAIKHLWRMGQKDPALKDLGKAKRYIERKIEELELLEKEAKDACENRNS